MNTALEEPGHETGRPSLWDRVREWLATWMAVFPPDEILRDGLTRRFALRCCNWLWPLEATVRRLIIAAALACVPAKLVPAPSQPGPRKPHKSSSPRGASFHIVSIRGGGASRIVSPSARAAARPERHLPFPSDALLRLGAPRPHPGVGMVGRRDNPLRRRGRIRPSDPDYSTPASEADYANCSDLLFGSPKERKPPPERGPDVCHRMYFRIPLESDDSEWRRIEKEWERILPAPGLAARIAALAIVLDSPEPHIHRLARRLAAEPGLAALLRATPPPLLRKPKYDHFGPQVDEDLVMLAHLAAQPPDTS
jgi:hypothetical protein